MLPSLVLNPATDKKIAGLVINIEPQSGDISAQGNTLRAKIAPNLKTNIERIFASDIGLVRQLERVQELLDAQEQFVSRRHIRRISVFLKGRTNRIDFAWGHSFSPRGT